MNNLETPTLPLDQIIVSDRLRERMVNIERLAESIRDNGLFHPVVVERIEREGEGGVPVVTYQLRTGGRRHAAHTLLVSNKVPSEHPEQFSRIPVSVFNEMSPSQRVKVELEENLQREGMTWLERLRGIIKYHKASKRVALEEGDNWTQEMTGEMFNMSQTSVSIAFDIIRAVDAGNEKVAKAETITDAIKILAGEKLDAAQAEQMRRIKLKREQLAAASGKTNGAASAPIQGAQGANSDGIGGNLPLLSSSVIVHAGQVAAENRAAQVQFTTQDVAAFYHHGNALELLPVLAKTIYINHIICDPPYAIDMKNLTREDMGRFEAIERIAATHNVEDNLKLLPEFLRIAYDCIAEDGFLCMWYDLDHHEKIDRWADSIGWRVQRWPLVWCKTTPCLNNAAQCNITKATEVCYMFRRSEKSIVKTKQSKNYLLAPGVATATHPFPKPYEVWKYLIETVSVEGQTIVDPFAGEGSALAAFFKTGRTPVGIELDERHIASGLNYVLDQISQKDFLDDILTPPL